MVNYKENITDLLRDNKLQVRVFIAPLVLFIFSLVIRILFTSSIATWDEGWAAIISRKMLEDQNWLVPVYFGEGDVFYLFDKPFLIFWFFSASMSFLGFTSLAAKLPVIVVGSALSPLAYFLVKGRGNDIDDVTQGFVAGLLISVSYFLILYSRTAYIDPVVTFFGVLAALSTIRSIDYYFDDNSKFAMVWMVAACLSTSLTILCKAWQGLIFLPAIGIYFVIKLIKRIESNEKNIAPNIDRSGRNPEGLIRLSSIISGVMVAIIYFVLNQSLIILSFIPFLFVLIFDHYQKIGIKQAFGSLETEKRVFIAIILYRSVTAILPAIVLNLVTKGIGIALNSVLSLLGIPSASILLEGVMVILSVLLLWPIFKWLIPHLEELSKKETDFFNSSMIKILLKTVILSLPALIVFIWGYALFIRHFDGSLVVLTLLFSIITLALLITLLILNRSFFTGNQHEFVRRTLVFELTAVFILLLAFLPLLFWIEWIDNATLGLIIRKSGEMGMHPEIPLPDPLTYRWLFFEYYLGWRYSYGTIYSVTDSLGAFLDPIWLATFPFILIGIYSLWKERKTEKGFFFFSWFLTVLIVFLPAKFQLNYYYYPTFFPYFCLSAIGIYKAAKKGLVVINSMKKRLSLLALLLVAQLSFIYLPILLSGNIDPFILISALGMITGGSFVAVYFNRNLSEIIGSCICLVGIHRFLTRMVFSLQVIIFLIITSIIASTIILVFFRVRKNIPLSSIAFLLVICITGIAGTANVISFERENDLHPEIVARYLIENGGSENYACWVQGEGGFVTALRYMIGNPLFTRSHGSYPFVEDESSVVIDYLVSNPEIKFWIVFTNDYFKMTKITAYDVSWSFFINLPDIRDVSEEAGLPGYSIVSIYRNVTASVLLHS